MRHTPQGLVSVHATAVRLQHQHLAVRAGDGRAQRHWQAAADCRAGYGIEVVVLRCCHRFREQVHARRGALIDHDGILRQQQVDTLPHRLRGQLPRGLVRHHARHPRRRRATGGQGAHKVGQRGRHVVVGGSEGPQLAALGHLVHGGVLVGKGRYRRQRAHQDDLLVFGKEELGHLEKVGHQLHLHPALAADHAGGERLGQQLRPGFGGDATGQLQALAVQGVGAQQEPRFTSVRQQFDRRRHGVGRHPRRCDRRAYHGRTRSRIPVAVGGRDEGTDLARARHGVAGGFRPQQPQLTGGFRLPGPVGHRAGQVGDLAADQLVFGEVGLVVAGVGADDVHHRRIAAAGVVQVGDTVGQTRPNMQQGKRRLAGHAAVAVGGAGDHVLLQAQYGAHRVGFAHLVHQLHFRCARVGKAGIEPRLGQRLEK